MENKEIERKFIVSGYPKTLEESQEYIVQQSYLQTDPFEVRFTRYFGCKGKSPKLTIKNKGGLQRTEVEVKIDMPQYDALTSILSESVSAEPIIKEYKSYVLYSKSLGNKPLTLEVSLVNNDFYYAEIEFETEEDALAFNADEVPFLIKEVTDDSYYRMANYWERNQLEAALSKS